MAEIRKSTGKAKSIPGGLAMSGLISMVITFVLCAAIAGFLEAEKITWMQAGYWIMGMLFLSSFIGSKCAFAAVKRQKVAICMMSGVLYWGLLLCLSALFFGGDFSAIWETAGMIAAGSGSAALLSAPRKKKPARIYC